MRFRYLYFNVNIAYQTHRNTRVIKIIAFNLDFKSCMSCKLKECLAADERFNEKEGKKRRTHSCYVVFQQDALTMSRHSSLLLMNLLLMCTKCHAKLRDKNFGKAICVRL